MLDIIFSFLTLSLLEILLGIDNIVILSLITNKLATPKLQKIARSLGLYIALMLRILLLFSITFIMRLQDPVFSIAQHPFSIKDLILLAGGLFLIIKGSKELIDMYKHIKTHAIAKSNNETPVVNNKKASLLVVIAEIAFLDTIFALDSIITAVAISDHLWIMIAANIFAIITMIFIVGWVSKFLEQNPNFKVLALSFLLLVGITLTADGLGIHIPKTYLYAIIAFSIFMETLNVIMKKADQSDNSVPKS